MRAGECTCRKKKGDTSVCTSGAGPYGKSKGQCKVCVLSTDIGPCKSKWQCKGCNENRHLMVTGCCSPTVHQPPALLTPSALLTPQALLHPAYQSSSPAASASAACTAACVCSTAAAARALALWGFSCRAQCRSSRASLMLPCLAATKAASTCTCGHIGSRVGSGLGLGLRLTG